jgi:replicative DNA helicase
MPLWDEELELAVLGAALLSPNAARVVVERCEPDDFYRERHRLVLAELARLLDAGERPDSVTVAVALPRDERPHVLSLTSYCPIVSNVALYVRRLRHVSARRRLAQVIERVEPELELGLPEALRGELVAAAQDPNVGQEG